MKYQSYVGIELESSSVELEQLKRDGYFIKEELLSDEVCDNISTDLDMLWSLQVNKFQGLQMSYFFYKQSLLFLSFDTSLAKFYSFPSSVTRKVDRFI